jgi:hypothetical protein
VPASNNSISNTILVLGGITSTAPAKLSEEGMNKMALSPKIV